MNIRKSIDIRVRVAGLVLAGLVMLVVAWWLGSPLFINRAVNEDFPAAPATRQPADAAALNAAETPVVLRAGSFTVVDDIHQGSGKAAIYSLPNGKRVLRLEDFNVTNGPDLFVYLSGHAQPRSSSELHGQGDFSLGRLKGNVGSQNYELPDDLDVSQFKSVVIYCKQFTTVFSTATLADAQG